jgi:nitroreductase
MMAEYAFLQYHSEQLTLEEMQRRASTFFEQMSKRRSVRHFAETPVPRHLIEQAIRTASTAPSGANLQPWTFVAVSNVELKQRIRAAAEAIERQSYVGGRMPEEWLRQLPISKTLQETHK